MSMFQFVCQITIICGLVVGLIVGLFSAPWYILGCILIAALVLTWRLMPSREAYLSEFVESFNGFQQAGHAHSSTPSPNQGVGSPSHVGQPSGLKSLQDAPAQPKTLSYRGAQYRVKEQMEQPVKPSPDPAQPLKYRGAKVRGNQPQP